MAWRVYWHPNRSLDSVRDHNWRLELASKANPNADERAEILALGLEGVVMEPMEPPGLVLELPDGEFQDERGNCVWVPPADPPWGSRAGTYSYEHVP